MKKLKFSIFGNCQSKALAEVLLENPDFAARWEWTPVTMAHQLTPELIPSMHNTFKELDLLIYQPFKGRGIRAHSSDELLKQLPSRAKAICIPIMYFDGYFPQLGALPGVQTPLNRVHDYLIVYFYLRGKSISQTIDSLQHPDLFKKRYSKKLFRANIAELRKREKKHRMGITISSFIEEFARKHLLFHQVNHPTKALFQHIANQLFEQVGVSSPFELEWGNKGPLSAVICPPLKSLYQYNQCDFDISFDTYIVFQERLSQSEVVNRMYCYFSKVGPETLKANLDQRKKSVISQINRTFR